MRVLCDDAFWDIEVTWSKPVGYERLIDNGSIHDDTAQLYMITGKYSNRSSKVFYIGKTYKQTVSQRLTQKDHKKRYDYLKENYSKHILYVSHGVVSVREGKMTAKKLKEIESILIYSMPGEHCINEKNFFSHGVTSQYWIENKGYKSNMPKRIGLGVFIK